MQLRETRNRMFTVTVCKSRPQEDNWNIIIGSQKGGIWYIGEEVVELGRVKHQGRKVTLGLKGKHNGRKWGRKVTQLSLIK